tara:strand:- start:10390 stop:10896 length:507 start_codon:yes stop_codon:yes gene_type:complete
MEVLILPFSIMKNNFAIFPGSFDPITNGHVDIVHRALKIFDNIIIAIGANKKKEYMFSIQDRIKMINTVFKDNSRVIIKSYDGLTVQFCEKNNTRIIIRGIRNHLDLEYEKNIALANNTMNENIETIYFDSSKEYQFLSSSIVKDVIRHKGSLEKFLPNNIINYINSI